MVNHPNRKPTTNLLAEWDCPVSYPASTEKETKVQVRLASGRLTPIRWHGMAFNMLANDRLIAKLVVRASNKKDALAKFRRVIAACPDMRIGYL
jgi:hypothetical protein